MTWTTFAGSGLHTWLVIAALVFLAWMTVRAIRMAETIPDSHPETLGSLDLRARGLDPVDGGLAVRPAPSPEAQAAAEARIDWDRPVGYGHAASVLRAMGARDV